MVLDRYRYERAMKENLFLTEFIEENLTFFVCGTKKTIYTIKFTENNITCTCMDYKIRKKNCKHILFCILKLGCIKFNELNNMFINNCFPFSKIFNRIRNEMKNRLIGNGTDCSICLCEMKSEGFTEESLVRQCNNCKNLFHDFCVTKWINSTMGNKKKCPLCRIEF